ncbi:hypothetical protein LCGC14_1113180 [marine sediment metagenome]|uniref:Uncharacterized protein n=1 Tax=marine sediment metagenome TaxID=412755 RepID=A0A0F9MU40_9ZZZZ
MFNAESLRIVGAMIDSDYLCRDCAGSACADTTNISQDEITTSVLQYWLSQDHGDRYAIRNFSESDYSPDGLVCSGCCDIIFEPSCIVCGDELDNDAKHTSNVQGEAYDIYCRKNRVYPEEGTVCSDCQKEIGLIEEENNDLCEGCPGIAVSFCLVAADNKQRFDCESFPRETK